MARFLAEAQNGKGGKGLAARRLWWWRYWLALLLCVVVWVSVSIVWHVHTSGTLPRGRSPAGRRRSRWFSARDESVGLAQLLEKAQRPGGSGDAEARCVRVAVSGEVGGPLFADWPYAADDAVVCLYDALCVRGYGAQESRVYVPTWSGAPAGEWERGVAEERVCGTSLATAGASRHVLCPPRRAAPREAVWHESSRLIVVESPWPQHLSHFLVHGYLPLLGAWLAQGAPAGAVVAWTGAEGPWGAGEAAGGVLSGLWAMPAVQAWGGAVLDVSREPSAKQERRLLGDHCFRGASVGLAPDVVHWDSRGVRRGVVGLARASAWGLMGFAGAGAQVHFAALRARDDERGFFSRAPRGAAWLGLAATNATDPPPPPARAAQPAPWPPLSRHDARVVAHALTDGMHGRAWRDPALALDGGDDAHHVQYFRVPLRASPGGPQAREQHAVRVLWVDRAQLTRGLSLEGVEDLLIELEQTGVDASFGDGDAFLDVRLESGVHASLAARGRLFAAADVVVGVHGDELGQALWMRGPGTALVEIMTPMRCNEFYAPLARAASVAYFAVHAWDGAAWAAHTNSDEVRKKWADAESAQDEACCLALYRMANVRIAPERARDALHAALAAVARNRPRMRDAVFRTAAESWWNPPDAPSLADCERGHRGWQCDWVGGASDDGGDPDAASPCRIRPDLDLNPAVGGILFSAEHGVLRTWPTHPLSASTAPPQLRYPCDFRPT